MIEEITNNDLTVLIDTRGGELKSIKRNGVEYLWQGDSKYWGKQAPNLFPFIARLYQEKYTYKGKEYQMPKHGFLKSNEMTTIYNSGYSLVLQLTPNDTIKESYPFDFSLQIEYKIDGNRLRIIFNILNNTDDVVYLSLGLHPGFNVPLDSNLKFSDYYLEFDSECTPTRIGFSKDNVLMNGNDTKFPLLNNNRINLEHNLFDDDAIILKDVSNSICLRSDLDNKRIRLTYRDMKYLGLWHPLKSDAPFLCIEPWSSLPGRDMIVEDIAKRDDYIKLMGNNFYNNEVIIEII